MLSSLADAPELIGVDGDLPVLDPVVKDTHRQRMADLEEHDAVVPVAACGLCNPGMFDAAYARLIVVSDLGSRRWSAPVS